jgi:hypothetical protein
MFFYTNSSSPVAAPWGEYVNSTLQANTALSDLYSKALSGSTSSLVYTLSNHPSGLPSVELQFEPIDGAIRVTEIDSYLLGVNTTALVKFLPQLPFLRSFKAQWFPTSRDPTLRQQLIPPKLAAVASPSLQVLELSGMNLCCRLPDEWSSWSTIVELTISGNSLMTGTLPDWGGMRLLKTLDLQDNDLTGTLPASCGLATWSMTIQHLYLSSSKQLKGTIPSSWTSIKAEIILYETNVKGCVPDQLINTVAPYIWPACSAANSTELMALKRLRRILDQDERVLTSWQEDPQDATPVPVPGERSCLMSQLPVGTFAPTGCLSLVLKMAVAAAQLRHSCALQALRSTWR